jgi:hypothetical protein
MHKRSVSLLMAISALLVYSLSGLVGSILLNAPTSAFALNYIATPTVTQITHTPTATITPSPVLPSPVPCIIIGNSPPFCSPFVSANKPPANYPAQQGTLIQITGQGWTAHAAIELYVLPAGKPASGSGNTALCPAQSLLIARNIAHSTRVMTNANGNFSVQLIIPTTLKRGLYSMCISVNGTGQMTSTLLFQIDVRTNPQLQTSAPSTGNAPPSSFMLSIIALILALFALLLYIFSPRQPVAPHLTNRRNAS